MLVGNLSPPVYEVSERLGCGVVVLQWCNGDVAVQEKCGVVCSGVRQHVGVQGGDVRCRPVRGGVEGV